MKYTTVIFDMDGTILDTLEDLTDTVNFALGKHDMPLRTIEEVRRFVGNGIRRLLELAVPDGENNPEFEQIFADFKEYYAAHCNDKTKVYPGILDLMDQLNTAGYKMAIVSNKVDPAVKELQKIYFGAQIEVAIGEKEGIAKKPAPDTVYQALKELGESKEHAIYVGDSEVDLATAVNSGLPCISVSWGFRDVDFLIKQGAVHIADTAAEVFQIITDMNKM